MGVNWSRIIDRKRKETFIPMYPDCRLSLVAADNEVNWKGVWTFVLSLAANSQPATDQEALYKTMPDSHLQKAAVGPNFASTAVLLLRSGNTSMRRSELEMQTDSLMD